MKISAPVNIKARLAMCTIADRRRLQRRMRKLQAKGATDTVGRQWQRFEADLQRCTAARAARARLSEAVTIPAHLPIAAHVQSIKQALQQSPVIIVCGDTGSGKSTQLPKICLLAGRGIEGQIVHTQPRRIAARGVARRLAWELGESLGKRVGFKVRFDEQVRNESAIKVVTDGILLAELGTDPRLHQYDTVIIDEAHERSLNIDVLLGYLQRLARQRADLKIIISSATLDSQKFAEFFAAAPVITPVIPPVIPPVINIEGRSHPITIQYQPPAQTSQDYCAAVAQALETLALQEPGDCLVFLAGEREINEVARHLARIYGEKWEILPLYARLSLARQDRLFSPHSKPRLVLATNIAETSLTIPGIRYVIDGGRERIGRYSPAYAVQRLPVVSISKASAAQRAGRCGREAPGLCIRLYSEADFAAFPNYQEAEIKRTDLAAVLLRLRSLGIRTLRQFPFIEPPARAQISDGLRLLRELDALDDDDELTATGRKLARLPVDPRVGRMLIKAAELGCVTEILIIAAALSIADVREHRPGQSGPLPQQLRFEDERSDFVRLLKIWKHLEHQAPGSNTAKLRKTCQRCRLSYPRVQEWREVHLQLTQIAREMGLHRRTASADYAQIHRALLAGLLRNLGQRVEKSEFAGLRGNRFKIARASGQAGRSPTWVLAAELVDTGQTLAFICAAVRPKWIEQAAGSLLRYGYFEGHWDEARGEPFVYEQSRLYSLTVCARRKIRFARVSPAGAREVFIRGALIEDRFNSPAEFIQANQLFVRQRREREARLRSPDALISDERVFEFYDRRIPASVFDTHTFEHWWRGLDLERRSDLLLEGHTGRRHAEMPIDDEYPQVFTTDKARLALQYRFDPGHEDDGVCVTLPWTLAKALDPGYFEWLVPGRVEEKIVALIRLLPKQMRRRLGPAANVARTFMSQSTHQETGLCAALGAFLNLRYNLKMTQEHWTQEQILGRLPAYLNMQFKVTDDAGQVLARGRDLARLQNCVAEHSGVSRRNTETPANTRAVRHDNIPQLEAQVMMDRNGTEMPMYPALVLRNGAVFTELVLDPVMAKRCHEQALRGLFVQRQGLDISQLARSLPQRQTLCLLYALAPVAVKLQRNPDTAADDAVESAPCAQLCKSIVSIAVGQAFNVDGGWMIRDQHSFDIAAQTGKARLAPALEQVGQMCEEILTAHHELQIALNQNWPLAWTGSVNDVREQSQWLVWQGFMAQTPRSRLVQMPRYLRAACRRLEKLQRGGAHDGAKVQQIMPLWERYLSRLSRHRQRGHVDTGLENYRWLLEEFRISLFAQELGVRERISRKRLDTLWQQITP